MALRSTPESREMYRKKLAEEHIKHQERTKKIVSGTHTATETGARALAIQRLQYFLREYDRERAKARAFKRGRETA